MLKTAISILFSQSVLQVLPIIYNSVEEQYLIWESHSDSTLVYYLMSYICDLCVNIEFSSFCSILLKRLKIDYASIIYFFL